MFHYRHPVRTNYSNIGFSFHGLRKFVIFLSKHGMKSRNIISTYSVRKSKLNINTRIWEQKRRDKGLLLKVAKQMLCDRFKYSVWAELDVQGNVKLFTGRQTSSETAIPVKFTFRNGCKFCCISKYVCVGTWFESGEAERSIYILIR